MDNQLTELMDKPEFKYAKTALARWKGYKADELKVGAWLDVLDALDIALQIIDCMAAHPSPDAPSTFSDDVKRYMTPPDAPPSEAATPFAVGDRVWHTQRRQCATVLEVNTAKWMRVQTDWLYDGEFDWCIKDVELYYDQPQPPAPILMGAAGAIFGPIEQPLAPNGAATAKHYEPRRVTEIKQGDVVHIDSLNSDFTIKSVTRGIQGVEIFFTQHVPPIYRFNSGKIDVLVS